MASYLDRYRNGDREQVWAELTALGGQVRQEPLLLDAYAVACETMTRAGENVRRIVSHLQTIGYEFGGPDSDQASYLSPPYQPPPDQVKPNVARMEQETGPWPLSMRAWYEVGGSVDLAGYHPDWPDIYTDPLVLFPIGAIFGARWDDGDLWTISLDPDYLQEGGEGWAIHLAPDYLHKADVSGGEAYAILVPDGSADGLLLNEWHDTALVPYLRECFRWGGFPGFDVRHPMNPQHLVEGVAMPPEHLALLTSDLLPI